MASNVIHKWQTTPFHQRGSSSGCFHGNCLQEWGKDAVEMTPGIVIAIPAEVKHWHGAAKDSWFQHLTYHRDAQEGAQHPEWQGNFYSLICS